jgi:hypothetical protein
LTSIIEHDETATTLATSTANVPVRRLIGSPS